MLYQLTYQVLLGSYNNIIFVVLVNFNILRLGDEKHDKILGSWSLMSVQSALIYSLFWSSFNIFYPTATLRACYSDAIGLPADASTS